MEYTRRAVFSGWRRTVFAIWVVSTMIAAGILLIAGPLANHFADEAGTWILSAAALVSPAVMAVMVVSGLVWLLSLVTAPKEGPPKRTSGDA